MSSKTVLWGACALVLSFPPGARAEGEGKGAPSAAATAPAPAPAEAPTLPPVHLEEVLVRLPRAEGVGDPTASVTVVEAARFAGEAKDVAALVATAPGVAVSEYGGLGQMATVSIRGSMATGVLVLLDGLPLDGGTTIGSDLGSIPRHWVERLEVIRGAEGAHFGAGAMSGVVNVLTRRPRAGAWSAEAGGGSFGTYALAGNGGIAAGPWLLFATGSLDGTRGDFPYAFDSQPSVGGNPLESRVRINNGASGGGLLLKAARPLGDWRLDLLSQLSVGRRELAGGPYALTPDDWQEQGRLTLSARLSGPGPLRDSHLAVRLHARADRLKARLFPATSTDSQDGLGGGGVAEGTLDHPGGQLRVALAGQGEATDAAGEGASRTRLGGAASVSEDLALLGGRLRLAPAVRAESVGPFRGLSAKLGSIVALAGTLSLRASAGRTFRPPSFAELYRAQAMVSPNPDLRSETSFAADTSLVLEGDPGLASLGAFTQLHRDLILYKPATFGRLKPFNAGKASASGVEVQLAAAPRPDLLGASASASYTFLHTEILRGSARELGKWLPQRARHRLYARTGVAPGPADLHVELHYVGRQYQDTENTAPIGAALLWSAGGSLRLCRSPALRLHLEVKNLTDDRTLRDGLGNPLPARLVMLTLRAGSSTTEGTP